MSCTTQFTPTVDVACIIATFTEIRTVGFSVGTAKNILWISGCVLDRFDGSEVPPTVDGGDFHKAFATMAIDEDASPRQAINAAAAQMIDNCEEVLPEKVEGFGAGVQPAEALNPALVALLFQLGQLALTWLNSRQ